MLANCEVVIFIFFTSYHVPAISTDTNYDKPQLGSTNTPFTRMNFMPIP
jgi:hypothetical protein